MSDDNEMADFTDEEKARVATISTDILEILKTHKATLNEAMQTLRLIMSGIICSSIVREHWADAVKAIANDLTEDCQAAVDDPNSPYNKRLRRQQEQGQ